MSTATDSRAKIVTSKDGTPIAYEVNGSGPALVLVDGALCSRAFGPAQDLSKALQSQFTVYIYDRRGRGDSGNTLPYGPEREVEDLAAVIDAAGGSAFVAGQSSGGGLTLLGAAAGLNIPKLAIYETPYMVDPDHRHPKDMLGDLQKLVAAKDMPGALRYFMVDMVGVPSFAMIFMKASGKTWRSLQAVAPTLPYDAQVMGGNFEPDTGRFASITAPALVMRGGKAPKWMRVGVELIAKTLPHSSYTVLPKQTHQVKASVLGPALAEFFTEK